VLVLDAESPLAHSLSLHDALPIYFVGIKSPNPFWLASAPPTDKAYNVVRAFQAGWGGVVWKTLGEEGPPVVNVNGPRYGAIWGRSEEHTSELQSREKLVCRLLLEK